MNDIVVDAWTTHGVGDFMFVLNRVHWLRRTQISNHKKPIKLNFHWYHSEDHLHHPEDPETIVERCDWIAPFYKNHRSIEINHVFNSTDEVLKQQRFRFQGLKNVPRHMHDNIWSFRMNSFGKEDRNKVVVWRPLHNAEPARAWKQVVINDMWNEAIDLLKGMGYSVVELTYRSSVREAIYHINTCHFVVCYDGMWHYIAKNWFKPMIVTSRSTITKYHTPHAMMWHEMDSDKNLINKLKNFHTPFIDREIYSPYQQMMHSALNYRDYFWRSYNACRLIEQS